ncbi:MAG: hypothetical protein HRU11_12665 [Parvularculaceae bacterium]|nr:hypothetical protein [Parvularculaceae bacterium]
MKLGIVCGLKSEAETVAGTPATVAVSGAHAGRAYAHACRLVDEGATTLISLGVSGALDPSVSVGELIVPRAVVDATGSVVGEAASGVVEVSSQTILGSDDLIDSAAEKSALRERTGAIAVDMESHAVARAATERGVPFVAIRAIADPASQVLPKAAAQAVAEDGSVRTLATLLGLLKRPQDLSDLLALGRQSAEAHATLTREAPRLIETIIRA